MKHMPDRDYLYTVLMEEAAEVVHAASKCIRFGEQFPWPEKNAPNMEMVAMEIGHMLGIVDALGLDEKIIDEHRRTKIGKVKRIYEEYRRQM